MIRYIVHADRVERLATAFDTRPHRTLAIDERGDAMIRRSHDGAVVTMMSGIEARFIVREIRRAARRRFWRRLALRRS